MDSFICLLNLSCSRSLIVASSQRITWLVFTAWSVVADLFGSPVIDAFLWERVNALAEVFSASDLCSLSLMPNNREVSPMYILSQLRRGNSYTQLAVWLMSVLSFWWTRILRRVWCGLKAKLHSTKYLWPIPDEKIAIYGQVQTDWPEVGSLSWRSVKL